MSFRLPRQGSVENPLRLAVLISGSGSGMEALLKHQEERCCHTTKIVISNKEDALGLKKAEQRGIPAVAIIPDSSSDREGHEREIDIILEKYEIEAVILSGYMRILSAWFVEKWEGRLLNIHPSLLPDFPGAHAHRDVIAAGAKVSGCTVHFVDTGVDSGRIIAQRSIPVSEDDTEFSLQEKVKKIEHTLYPEVIDAFAESRLQSFS